MNNFYIFLFSILTLSQGFAADEMSTKKPSIIYTQSSKHLNDAMRFAQQLNDPDVRNALIFRLESCQECLQNCLQRQDYAQFASKTETMNENIDEILADCDQNDLREELCYSVAQLSEQFAED